MFLFSCLLDTNKGMPSHHREMGLKYSSFTHDFIPKQDIKDKKKRTVPADQLRLASLVVMVVDNLSLNQLSIHIDYQTVRILMPSLPLLADVIVGFLVEGGIMFSFLIAQLGIPHLIKRTMQTTLNTERQRETNGAWLGESMFNDCDCGGVQNAYGDVRVPGLRGHHLGGRTVRDRDL